MTQPLLFASLLALDAALTLLAVSLGAMEGNPILRLAASLVGLPWAVTLKTLLGVGIGVCLWRLGAYRILRVVNLGLILVTAVNVTAILLVQ